MNEPHKPKLTDYLTEALAKSLTEEGRQSLLEERKLLEALAAIPRRTWGGRNGIDLPVLHAARRENQGPRHVRGI